MKAHTLLAVALGGLIGGLGRALTVQAFAPLGFEYTILLINWVGCGAVAYFLGYVRTRFEEIKWNELVRPFFVTGILGGFTTTSALAVIVAINTKPDRIFALAYALASVVGGFKIYEFVYNKVSR